MDRSARLIFLMLVVAGSSLYFFFTPSTDAPFSPALISSQLIPHPRWAVAQPLPEEVHHLRAILSQTFTFLGEGEQAMAFQSEDGKTVLKFFKMRKLTPSFRDQLCPHVARRRLRNLHWVFNGYKNAFQELRKETGLVWIHLAKTAYLQHTIKLIDQAGKVHAVDADSTEFVIQEKAELIFKYLARLQSQEERDKAIASVDALICCRLEKGYADRDCAVSNNYGFVGDRPIQLDIGRLYKGTKQGERERIHARIQRWVQDPPGSSTH